MNKVRNIELIDIVDKRGKLLYQSTKEHAHKQGLLHKTVVAAAINSKGEWMLVRQSKTKQDAGQYVFPVGGHVTAKESEEDALRRETVEEMGVEKFEFKFLGRGIFSRTVLKSKENHLFHFYEIYTDSLPILGEESTAFDFFGLKNLNKHIKNNPGEFGYSLTNLIRIFYPEIIEQ